MKREMQRRLERAGWQVGDAGNLLLLSLGLCQSVRVDGEHCVRERTGGARLTRG